MMDATPRPHSPAADVTRALLDIKPASEKFSIFTDRLGRIAAYWFLADEGSTLNYMVYRIELLAESGEYTSVLFEDAQPKVQQNSWFRLVSDPYAVPFSYTFTDTDLKGPVDQVLATHGWVHKGSAPVSSAKPFGEGQAMTDVAPRLRSSAAEVARAVLKVMPAGNESTIITDREGRTVVTWFRVEIGATRKTTEYRIILLQETGEYTSSMYELKEPNVQPSLSFFGTDSYSSYESSGLPRTVVEALAAHGWTRKRSAFAGFFARLFGRA